MALPVNEPRNAAGRRFDAANITLQIVNDPRLALVTPSAGLLYIRLYAWSAANETDGRIPRKAVAEIGRTWRASGFMASLADAGLITSDGDDWRLDWSLQLTADGKQGIREKGARRQARWRARRRTPAAGTAPAAGRTTGKQRTNRRAAPKPLTPEQTQRRREGAQRARERREAEQERREAERETWSGRRSAQEAAWTADAETERAAREAQYAGSPPDRLYPLAKLAPAGSVCYDCGRGERREHYRVIDQWGVPVHRRTAALAQRLGNTSGWLDEGWAESGFLFPPHFWETYDDVPPGYARCVLCFRVAPRDEFTDGLVCPATAGCGGIGERGRVSGRVADAIASPQSVHNP